MSVDMLRVDGVPVGQGCRFQTDALRRAARSRVVVFELCYAQGQRPSGAAMIYAHTSRARIANLSAPKAPSGWGPRRGQVRRGLGRLDGTASVASEALPPWKVRKTRAG